MNGWKMILGGDSLLVPGSFQESFFRPKLIVGDFHVDSNESLTL